MGSKVISITEDVYELLKSFQLPKESFGETIKRLCTQYSGKNISLWMTTLPKEDNIPKDLWDTLETDITKSRIKNLIKRDLEI